MSELAARFDLKSAYGLTGAEDAAARFSDDYGYRCRACAALKRGYHHSRLALVAKARGNAEGHATELEAAGRAFCEAAELAHRGEGVAA